MSAYATTRAVRDVADHARRSRRGRSGCAISGCAARRRAPRVAARMPRPARAHRVSLRALAQTSDEPGAARRLAERSLEAGRAQRPKNASPRSGATTSVSAIRGARISRAGACRDWPKSKSADSRRAGRQLSETAMRFSGRPSGIAPRDGAPPLAGSSASCAGSGSKAFTRQPEVFRLSTSRRGGCRGSEGGTGTG